MNKNTICGKNGFEVMTLTITAPNTAKKYIETGCDAVLYDLVSSSLQNPGKNTVFMMLPKPLFPKSDHKLARTVDTKEKQELTRKVLRRNYAQMRRGYPAEYYRVDYE